MRQGVGRALPATVAPRGRAGLAVPLALVASTALVALVVLAGCGSAAGPDRAGSGGHQGRGGHHGSGSAMPDGMSMPHGGSMPDGMSAPPDVMMGDPSATPAYQVAGAEVRQAGFVLLRTAPPGSGGAAGTAWLAQNDAGTTVTITMTGLRPGRRYLAHLHVRPCTDPGGPHFRFDPAGPATPPNEVHLGFSGGPDGAATVTVHNGRKVGDGAHAVVVHPADAMDNRLACADF